MVSEFEKNYRGYVPRFEDQEETGKYFEVKEYDSLQIAEIKFLAGVIGLGLGGILGVVSTLVYLWK